VDRVREKTVLREDTTTRNELVRLIDEKQALLAAAQKSLADAGEQVAQLESRVESIEAERKSLADSARDWKERAETASRVAAAMEAEVKGRSERMARIESINRELAAKGDESAKRSERVSKAARELEELARRREVHLANLLRRYREVTDQYRSLAVRGGDLPVGVDLSRIQSAIQLAEEDMRQLQSLGAQAERLQRELSGLRR
jgi:chromosome segregation ATPase